MEQEPSQWDMMGDDERQAEFNAVVTQNMRLTAALEKIAVGADNLGWAPAAYIAKQALERKGD